MLVFKIQMAWLKKRLFKHYWIQKHSTQLFQNIFKNTEQKSVIYDDSKCFVDEYIIEV